MLLYAQLHPAQPDDCLPVIAQEAGLYLVCECCMSSYLANTLHRVCPKSAGFLIFSGLEFLAGLEWEVGMRREVISSDFQAISV